MKAEKLINVSILSIFNLLFWMVFIGWCIQTGTIGLAGKTIFIEKLYLAPKLSELSHIGLFHDLNIGLVLLVATGLKAC